MSDWSFIWLVLTCTALTVPVLFRASLAIVGKWERLSGTRSPARTLPPTMSRLVITPTPEPEPAPPTMEQMLRDAERGN